MYDTVSLSLIEPSFMHGLPNFPTRYTMQSTGLEVLYIYGDRDVVLLHVYAS